MIVKITLGEVEAVSTKPEPAADEKRGTQEPEPAPKGEEDQRRRDPRLAMTLREAEIIAQNLKKSGTRR